MSLSCRNMPSQPDWVAKEPPAWLDLTGKLQNRTGLSYHLPPFWRVPKNIINKISVFYIQLTACALLHGGRRLLLFSLNTKIILANHPSKPCSHFCTRWTRLLGSWFNVQGLGKKKKAHNIEMLATRDERVQHYLYLYLYLLTIWIICICIRTRTGRGLTRKWAGFNLEVGRVVLKWAGL